MSISDRHSILALATIPAIADQRLARAIFKTLKDSEGKALPKRESMGAYIPFVNADDIELARTKLSDATIRNLIESAQDGILKARVLADASSISDAELDMFSCATYLDAEAQASARITGESLKAFYVSNIQEMLTVALADRLGISDTPTAADTKKLSVMLANYADKFSGLAGKKVFYPAPVVAKLSDALSLVDSSVEDHPIVGFIKEKLAAMNPENADGGL